MGDLSTASKGLAWIMQQVGSTQWAKLQRRQAYIIYKFGYKGRPANIFQVPFKNVESADRELETDTPPLRWVYQDILKLSSLPDLED